MEQKQKRILKKFLTVLILTIVMVAGLANLKNYINRAEAMRAMEIVGKHALVYRQKYGSLPPEAYIKSFLERIQAVRLENIDYRATWIEYGSDPGTTILAYSKRTYHGLLGSGYVVLWLNGKVEWMTAKKCEPILHRQQQQRELDSLQKHLKETTLP